MSDIYNTNAEGIINTKSDDGIKYAMAVYGFLLPYKERTPSAMFAQLIRNYSVHPRGSIVAAEIASLQGTFYRDFPGSVTMRSEASSSATS